MNSEILKKIKDIPFEQRYLGQSVHFYKKDKSHFINTLTGEELILDKSVDKSTVFEQFRTENMKLQPKETLHTYDHVSLSRGLKRACLIYEEPMVLAPGYVLIRLYQFYAVGIAKKQATKEFLRLVIDPELNIETVDAEFNVAPFEEASLYKLGSIFKKRIGELITRPLFKFPKDAEYDDCSECYLSKVIRDAGIRGTLEEDALAPFPNFLDVREFLIWCTKKTHGQWFRSNTPEFIKESVLNEKSESLGIIKHDDYLLVSSYFDSARLYVTKDYYYVFKRNFVNGKFSSSNIFAINSSLPRDLNKDHLEGTCFERLTVGCYDAAFCDLVLQYRYLALEQARKVLSPSGCGIISYAIFNEAYNNAKNRTITPKMTLKDVFPVKPSIIKKIDDTGHSIMSLSALRKTYDGAYETFHDQEQAFFATILFCRCFTNDLYFSDTDKNVQKIFENKQMILAMYRNYKKGIVMADIVKTMNHYRDYLKIRKQVLELVPDYPMLQIPVLPEHIKPSKIDEYHDTASRFYDTLQDYKRNTQIAVYSQKISDRYKDEAKDWEYTNGTYALLFPKNAEEIRNEGIKLHHCVGSYCGMVANKQTTILFLRDVTNINAPLMTMEVSNDGFIKQFFAYHDAFNSDPDIAEFVREFAAEKGFDVTCTIYKEAEISA